MPYYPDIHTLLLHIPKTGGTTVEEALKAKSSQILYSSWSNDVLSGDLKNQSLQHLTYMQIYYNRHILSVPIDDTLKIITIVRNPYHRVISDLFFFRYIEKQCPPIVVTDVLKKYISKTDLDNHNIPQYKYVVDENNQLIQNIIIMKNETLTDDLKLNGISCDGIFYQKGTESSDNYMKYFDREGLDIVNTFYHKDFELFQYDKL